jgi:glycosyltransferase involved in cell wall biosynthesis
VTGGIGSIVNNGINGFGFNPFNIENVCNYIIDYIKHPIEYEKLQYSSYEYYLNELNWDIICKKMLDRMKGNHNLEV